MHNKHQATWSQCIAPINTMLSSILSHHPHLHPSTPSRNPIPRPTRLTIHFLLNSSLAHSLIRLPHTSPPMRPLTNPSVKANIAASYPLCSATLSYSWRATTVGGMIRSSIGGILSGDEEDLACVMVRSAELRVVVRLETLDWSCVCKV